MRPLIFSAFCLLSILATGCSKEEEEKELVKSFEGVVINSNTNEPLPNAQIELIGYPYITGLGGPKYTAVFQVGTNGSFDFNVTTTEVRIFEIQLQISNQRIANWCGDNHPTINGYCSLIEPGRDYTALQIFGNPENPSY